MSKEKAIYFFSELDPEVDISAGGKARFLARLYKLGFPVPNGFIVMPNAFDGNKLKDEMREIIGRKLNILASGNKTQKFAIRSSATVEDSENASFAGEFETFLGLNSKSEILHAIEKVNESKSNKRVKKYYEQFNIKEKINIAVIVQIFINPMYSGVIFTADPITGNRSIMVGNYIKGLGENLVGGKENPFEFKFNKYNSLYSGPNDLKKKLKILFRYAKNLDQKFGPQDVEFAVTNHDVYILQTRPITTLKQHNPSLGEWNSSLLGDFLWSSTNSSEAFSEIMTPLTWSIFSHYYEKTTPFKIKNFPSSIGNIGGRLYFNYSIMFSILTCALGQKRALNYLEILLGKIPSELGSMSKYDQSFLKRIQIGVLVLFRLSKVNRTKKIVPKYLETFDEELKNSIRQIEKANSLKELKSLWKTSFEPAAIQGYKLILATGGDVFLLMSELSEELHKLLPDKDVNILLSHLGGRDLASLGPLIGLSEVKKGKMSKEEYYEKYGHRGYAEGEFSIPRPLEIPNWLEKQLAIYSETEINIDDLLAQKEMEFNEVLQQFKQKYPNQAPKIEKKLRRLSDASLIREEIRSKTSKATIPVRLFLKKIGVITRQYDNIYFLTLDELLGKEDYNDLGEIIRKRKSNYEKQKSLNHYPTFIRGFFDPLEWSKDSNRRTNIFNSHQSIILQEHYKEITGFPGATGIREGIVRKISSPDEGHLLKTGEILVTRATNIGWTILFPKVSAIITDIGAPLSHAVIVAREIGIPAVVGCKNATMILKSGMKVRVDGGRGKIQILTDSY
ncbi:MAG: PEP/pyruvate-binding domain-containing protein [Candidatus Thorarchaeota archaeon]